MFGLIVARQVRIEEGKDPVGVDAFFSDLAASSNIVGGPSARVSAGFDNCWQLAPQTESGKSGTSLGKQEK